MWHMVRLILQKTSPFFLKTKDFLNPSHSCSLFNTSGGAFKYFISICKFHLILQCSCNYYVFFPLQALYSLPCFIFLKIKAGKTLIFKRVQTTGPTPMAMILFSAAVPQRAMREQCCITGKAPFTIAQLQTNGYKS